jgi:methionine sulfoxide reductase heme-binding subunit
MTATLAPFWVTSRAAGIAAIILAGLSISAGLLLATRSPLARGRAAELRSLHEALALATFAAVALHGIALVFDPWLKPGLAGVLVPFAAPHRAFATGLGQLAALGMAALGLTFYVRRRLGTQRWRRAHRFIPTAWALALVHGIAAGTDGTSAWFLASTLPVAAAALVLLVSRWREPAGRALGA